jgi:hypothetical protein
MVGLTKELIAKNDQIQERTSTFALGPIQASKAMIETAMIGQDPKAWAEGFRAGEEGESRCPYPAGSLEAFAWHSGHVEGAAKRKACHAGPILKK